MTSIAERYTPAVFDPWTVRQLKQLRPGERFTYYKGDFERDITSNAAVKLGSEEPDLFSAHQWTGAYVEILRAVRRTAAQLARDGLVALSVTEHKGTFSALRKRKGEPTDEVEKTYSYNEYHAVGLRRGNVIPLPLPTLTEIERNAEISFSADNPPDDGEGSGTRIHEPVEAMSE